MNLSQMNVNQSSERKHKLWTSNLCKYGVYQTKYYTSFLVLLYYKTFRIHATPMQFPFTFVPVVLVAYYVIWRKYNFCVKQKSSLPKNPIKTVLVPITWNSFIHSAWLGTTLLQILFLHHFSIFHQLDLLVLPLLSYRIY